MSAQVIHGKCEEIMPTLLADSVDSVVTDPPYNLGFLGKSWDRTGIAFDPALWRETLRVLKPGGHLLAFGGTRTSHRLTCAIEDAGFEIRDSIAWLHSQGMPKHATQLKPAHEPIVVARKPFRGSQVQNTLTYGTGGMYIDGCRIPTDQKLGRASSGFGTALSGNKGAAVGENYGTFNSIGITVEGGRWPANVITDEEQAAVLEAQETGASRFFYCAKASVSERPRVDGVTHNTVKPLALMRWLCRLVTPPGGKVLDPFAGSGTTLEAAQLENLSAIGIESDATYLPLIHERLNR